MELVLRRPAHQQREELANLSPPGAAISPVNWILEQAAVVTEETEPIYSDQHRGWPGTSRSRGPRRDSKVFLGQWQTQVTSESFLQVAGEI